MIGDLIISFENVVKTYKLYKNDRQRFLGLIFNKSTEHKTFTAINDVSFSIRKGESVGIVGRNGAGKSTLLKLITGVCFSDSGQVTVNGNVAALLELAAGFDAEMTGRENIYLKGCILGLSKNHIKDIEDDIIEFAELDDFIDQPVRTYSSGMKARLGFAINVGIDPDILVIDEALSVGDAAFGEKCKNKVAEIIDEGATVLFVSHSQDKIKEFCKRGLLLEKGSLVLDSDIDTVTREYEKILKEVKKKKSKPKPKK